MERMRLGISLLLVAAVAASLSTQSCTSGKVEATPAAVDPVVRGRYLTTIMSCNDCHTPGYFYGAPDTMRKLSGSDLGWIGPWGVVHARNLTPDMETGLGKWSADDIVKALRSGNTPDGRQLAVIMPWQNYSSILDEGDAQAIAAYLKSLPPIVHKNLDVIPPGSKPTGNNVMFPPPPAWDVPPPPPAQATSK